MGYFQREILKPGKPLGFRVLNVGFRVLVGFQFSGSGRVRVAKKLGYSPGFRVFGFKDPSLNQIVQKTSYTSIEDNCSIYISHHFHYMFQDPLKMDHTAKDFSFTYPAALNYTKMSKCEDNLMKMQLNHRSKTEVFFSRMTGKP